MEKKITELVKLIILSEGVEKKELIKKFMDLTKMDESIVENLFIEENIDYIFERINAYNHGDLNRTKEELIDLVKKMIEGVGSKAEVDEWLRIIEHNVPMPRSEIIGLIYYPENVDEADPEDVILRALNYKRNIIQL